MRWQEVNIRGTFFVVSWWLVVAALVFAALVGLLSGLYPAARTPAWLHLTRCATN